MDILKINSSLSQPSLLTQTLTYGRRHSLPSSAHCSPSLHSNRTQVRQSPQLQHLIFLTPPSPLPPSAFIAPARPCLPWPTSRHIPRPRPPSVPRARRRLRPPRLRQPRPPWVSSPAAQALSLSGQPFPCICFEVKYLR